MLSRISHLAEKFRIGTEKRINKTERRTLEYSYILNEKLSNLSNKILDIMGKNKSYKQATNQLKHDINVLQDISDQMHKDSSDRLQSLKVSISNCLEKEQKLSSLMESLTISKNIDLLNNDLFDEQIKCINLKESKLTEDLQTLRNKYEHALFQYEEYMNMNNKQVNRLKQLIQARNHLCQLVCDCKTALWEAYEMLETEYATKLSLTERIQRQDHLLTAFFILLYTCDQLVSRITPYEIGDFRLNYITSSIPSASIKQSSRGNNVMYSDSGHTFSSTPLAKSDIQTRKSSENNESNGMIRDLFENDHNLISDFPLASEFGLEPVDSTKQNSFTVNLLKELSKYSRRSGRRTNTPILRSVAVQTELFMSREQSPNSYKQKKLDKLCFIRSNRGVLQLPMLNTKVLAPKEDYDSLYRFNIKPTIRDKSPLLPSLHKLAKM
ncbi:hypothetical protein EWB00_006823 [Schistosoma japonicum]|uniref:Cilia- and flagella-associated protein 157 n=1 Tax=Schistosoma japonicum TaxID=6182 RepID=A0A4Z2CXK0_SCHJA|nr:hypothetical protein EWB00_006823 [Schistosoma japonicum]